MQASLSFSNRLTRFIFFGNVFYGICALALSIEASLQQSTPFNDWIFYVLLFSSTVAFYGKAYIVSEEAPVTGNERTDWYRRNARLMRWLTVSMTTIFAIGGLFFLLQHGGSLQRIGPLEMFVLAIFPIASFLYYGFSARPGLRQVGWLKPFIIGFSWAGMVTVFPVLYHHLISGTQYHITFVGILLFIKNFMFISVLCIMFDIKDYAMDYNARLKTLAVKLGLRKTLFFVIMPLCAAGLVSFLLYAGLRQFHPMKIALNVVPFIAVLVVAYGLQFRRNIFYYLVIIDGLMLLKAVCGSVAMSLY